MSSLPSFRSIPVMLASVATIYAQDTIITAPAAVAGKPIYPDLHYDAVPPVAEVADGKKGKGRSIETKRKDVLALAMLFCI